MRILFVSAQLPGHLDWGGYLPTAAELTRRGHEVLWASGAEVSGQLRQAGVSHAVLAETGWRWPPPPPLAPDPAADPAVLLHARRVRSLDQWLDPDRVVAATLELFETAERFLPDLIVGEMFMAAAAVVAELLQATFAVVGWPAPAPRQGVAQDEMTRVARARLESVLSRFDASGINWTQEGPPALSSPHLHITYWNSTWFDGVPLGAQTRHVGGVTAGNASSADSPLEGMPDSTDGPIVLITLGTSFNNDPNFFIAAAHAADQLGCVPLIALGRAPTREMVAALRDRLPRASRIFAVVDYGRVLPRVSAAIHHGGAGTTHALVTHAVPQIVAPHAGDQARQAQGVARCAVGYQIPPAQISIETLAAMLANLLPDLAPARANARALRDDFATLGGVPAAADLLETVVG